MYRTQQRRSTNGSVWESNPLRALFKPPAGFEDQARHQPWKHSRIVSPLNRSRHSPYKQQGVLIALKRPFSLHLVGPAFAVEEMACFSAAFCFAWSWLIAAHDE